MAEVSNASATWQSFVVTENTTIQVLQGAIFLEGASVAATVKGVLLDETSPRNMLLIQTAVSKTVYYRLASGTAALFVYVAL